jgi:hypothetical protein
VGRGARRRLLRAADDREGTVAIRREWFRGDSALRSLARLGWGDERIGSARTALAGFARQEAGGVVALRRTETRSTGVVPVRRVPAPLHYHRHLLPGDEAMPRSRRERWRALESGLADGLSVAELAWYACDGQRSLEDITDLVALETGRREPEFLEEFFELTSELGLSESSRGRDAAWSSKAPVTGTP